MHHGYFEPVVTDSMLEARHYAAALDPTEPLACSACGAAVSSRFMAFDLVYCSDKCRTRAIDGETAAEPRSPTTVQSPLTAHNLRLHDQLHQHLNPPDEDRLHRDRWASYQPPQYPGEQTPTAVPTTCDTSEPRIITPVWQQQFEILLVLAAVFTVIFARGLIAVACVACVYLFAKCFPGPNHRADAALKCKAPRADTRL
jgi:hypothetical protein